MTLERSSSPSKFGRSRGLTRFAARLVQRVLSGLEAGHLQVILPDGSVADQRGTVAGPEATVVVRHWRALWRVFRQGEDGFTDSYLDGDWTTPDLVTLLDLLAANESALAKPAQGSWLTVLRDRLLHRFRANTLRGSRRNIAAHYDLGNAFYREWLDRGMNYSSALYAGEETLEAAQDRKLDRIVSMLELEGRERVLEIGCGWGALAERVVHSGSSIVGLTLSQEQLAFARDRLRDAPAGRADLRLQDYRDVEGAFDRVVSIEMIEAVGERYWPTYFASLRASLSDRGIAVLQAITIEEARFPLYRKRPDFIQRFIFPGGMLPTTEIIEAEAARAGLELVERQSFGESYARTLREWRMRFLHSWSKIEPLGFDQRFRRMWEYYLAYCEVGFQSGSCDVGLFKFVVRT